MHIASINDNLFTMLVRHAVPREIGCRLLSTLGPLTARFSEHGLAELYFDDFPPEDSPQQDGVFRHAFLKWLRSFQALASTEQWNYLAPVGTDFQKTVWQAVLEVPSGERATYQDIAKAIGRPKASRAVGSAVAANPIGLLIPCHRIVQSSGAIGNYRWGADRKLALLDTERTAAADFLHFFQ